MGSEEEGAEEGVVAEAGVRRRTDSPQTGVADGISQRESDPLDSIRSLRIEELVQFLRNFPREHHHGAIAVGALRVPPDDFLHLRRIDEDGRWKSAALTSEVEELFCQCFPLVLWKVGAEGIGTRPRGFDSPGRKLPNPRSRFPISTQRRSLHFRFGSSDAR
jgi:hypothetical protein